MYGILITRIMLYYKVSFENIFQNYNGKASFLGKFFFSLEFGKMSCAPSSNKSNNFFLTGFGSESPMKKK